MTMMFKPGKSYKCVDSKSVGYKKGRVYEVYKNAEGYLCMTGEDGLEDLCSMLVSSFEETKPLCGGINRRLKDK